MSGYFLQHNHQMADLAGTLEWRHGKGKYIYGSIQNYFFTFNLLNFRIYELHLEFIAHIVYYL